MLARPSNRAEFRLLVMGATLMAAAWPLAVAQHASGEQKVVVVGVTGDWTLNNAEDLRKVKKDGYVHFLDPYVINENTCAYGSEGALVLQFDKNAYSYPCRGKTDSKCPVDKTKRDAKTISCSMPVYQEFRTDSQNPLMAAIAPLFHESVERFIQPVSRGLEPQMADGVVLLRAGQVDLTPVFADLSTGKYRLRLERLDQPGQAAVTAETDWKEGDKATLTQAVAAGLYKVSAQKLSGEAVAGDAWVLLCHAKKFAQESANYQIANEATQKWPAETDARAARAVLRAYLEAMAHEPDAEKELP